MPSVSRVNIPLDSSPGDSRWRLVLELLPAQSSEQEVLPLLLDERNVLGAAEDAAAPIQLLEDSEYRYRVEGPGQQSVRVHPDEVFDPDSEDGRTGRLRTRLRTGSVLVRVMVEDTTVGQCRLEVRARKLGWRDEYR